jgi:hypothetical protein
MSCRSLLGKESGLFDLQLDHTSVLRRKSLGNSSSGPERLEPWVPFQPGHNIYREGMACNQSVQVRIGTGLAGKSTLRNVLQVVE